VEEALFGLAKYDSEREKLEKVDTDFDKNNNNNNSNE
jgi:hypothetical protein